MLFIYVLVRFLCSVVLIFFIVNWTMIDISSCSICIGSFVLAKCLPSGTRLQDDAVSFLFHLHLRRYSYPSCLAAIDQSIDRTGVHSDTSSHICQKALHDYLLHPKSEVFIHVSAFLFNSSVATSAITSIAAID